MKQYRHAAIIPAFMAVYLACFSYLENTVVSAYHVIFLPIDNWIPFCEYFIVPYLLWFPFIAATVIYFVFADRREYYQVVTFLGIGMLAFLIISFIYPNGHYLRPTLFLRSNIFLDMVKGLYAMDTPTNILPSIHVYNTLGAQIAICSNKQLSGNRWILWGSMALSVSIVLSTMFLKQHSVFDVVLGFVFAGISYAFIYRAEPAEALEGSRYKRLRELLANNRVG